MPSGVRGGAEVAVDVRGRQVLLTGGSDAVVAHAHRFLSAGATVHVAPTRLETSLRDLAERGLVTVVTAPDLTAYELVLACRDEDREPVSRAAAPGRGEVVLVGGGPGDPRLLTVAALEELRLAEVVVYDRLAPLAALEEARPGAELIDVGKIPRGDFTPQERINDILLEHALAGRRVVRFKGGDNFVFGRGGEEALACAERGIPVTHRSLTQGVTVVSGHVPPGDPRGTLDWAALARGGTTLVVLMGVKYLPEIVSALVDAGMPADTPAATIADAALPSMRVVRAELTELPLAVSESGLGAPAVTVIGQVAALDVLAPATVG